MKSEKISLKQESLAEIKISLKIEKISVPLQNFRVKVRESSSN